MPVFGKEVTAGQDSPAEMVSVRVTKRGHGKVSTGVHDHRHGEQYFAEGEVFEMEKGAAELLASEDGDAPRMYVEIVKKPPVKREPA